MTPEIIPMLIPTVTAFGLSAVAVGAVIKRLTLDHPNDRSSHSVPTPRGGGLGAVPAALLAWLLFSDYRPWALIVGALLLMAGSWIDDRQGLSPLTRLLAQAAMVAWVTVSLDLGLLPSLGLGFLLLWFVNLYNFMDGIDGITGIETVSLSLGIAIVAQVSGTGSLLVIPALCLAGAALGFLLWNWHPAKVFLGDCGSVPLGVLTGGLLIVLAVLGQWQAALILPAYYLADASLTLGYRLLRGEKIWQAHRKHFYQRATRGGAGPRKVALTILLGNLGLIGCAAAAAMGRGTMGLIAGLVITTAILGVLGWWGRNAPP